MATTQAWIELSLDTVGEQLRIACVTSDGRHPPPRICNVSLSDLQRFASGFSSCIEQGTAPSPELRQLATDISSQVFMGDARDALFGLLEAFSGRLLLTLRLENTPLHAIPWEAIGRPDGQSGLLGTWPKVLVTRGVRSNDPWDPRTVKGAVTVLGISPRGAQHLRPLRDGLDDSIKAGEIEWLEPAVGSAARRDPLMDRIVVGAEVIHFVGHGAFVEGVPALELKAEPDGEMITINDLADHLMSGSQRLRLVVLEACEGGRPGDLASAAELLCRAGADAVVAHLWPVRTDTARRCSRALYRSLAGRAGTGDVARACRDGRLAVDGPEAASLILYLKNPNPVLFEFIEHRVLVASQATAPTKERGVHPAIARVVSKNFTLLLGDFDETHASLAAFRKSLADRLTPIAENVPPVGPLSAIAQRFSFHFGESALNLAFQDCFDGVATELPFLSTLAKHVRPGVHISLQRLPILEEAIAAVSTSRILVIQPPVSIADSPTGYWRSPGGALWINDLPPLSHDDLEDTIVVLRLFGGYRPRNRFSPPLLTENDYLFSAERFDSLVGLDRAPALLDAIKTRPMLLVGVSKLYWHHRMLIHRIFGQTPLPLGSVVVVDPTAPDRQLWTSRARSLAGDDLEVAALTTADLAAQLGYVA